MPYSRSFLPVCWFICSTELKRRHGVNLGEVGVMLSRHIQTVRDVLEPFTEETNLNGSLRGRRSAHNQFPVSIGISSARAGVYDFDPRPVNSRPTVVAADRNIRCGSRLGWPQQPRDRSGPQT